jgi:DNA recombination protein RmuC
MENMIFAVLLLLVVVLCFLLLLLKKAARETDPGQFSARLDALTKGQERAESKVNDEAARSREELSRMAREQRQELVAAFAVFGDSVVQRMNEAAGFQKGQLEGMSVEIGRLADSNEKKLEALRLTVEGKLRDMQVDTTRQLELMRQTVDEKLQGTLEKRLGESFRQVSERLELVHKGLGEMQTLATGVGDLKKVLTNVKTRGTWGEVQLGALLEQVLTVDQYGVNVAIKGDGERVEFAVKLPGQGVDAGDSVWLPIDAKFPIEDYQRLLDAHELGDPAGVEAAGKQLESRVKACAGDICRKYLSPPQTTDFAILFLPIEGLFAEVIRRPALVETIQRQCRVVIAGPTTLWSILNSLQMGFRTLAIQKRSSEVWNLLAAVKTEWARYGDVLEAVQKKLHQASETIDKVQVRSRVVGRKLKDVQELPVGEAATLLALDLLEENASSASGEDHGL